MQTKDYFIFAGLISIYVLIVLFSLFVGTDSVSSYDILTSFFSSNNQINLIVQQIRIPRIIIASLTGMALSVSGCVFQVILKNPLADSFTLGISAGAAFGASLGFMLIGFLSVWYLIPLFSFIGALISVVFVYLVSAKREFSSNSMILSGVIVSYVFSSLLMLVFSMSNSYGLQSAFMWICGSLSNFDERLLWIVSIVVIMGTLVISFNGNILDLIFAGSLKSKTLGVNINHSIKFLFLIASLISACCVCVSGIIGFVGLMIPHFMRKIIGTRHIKLIPASAICGAIFLPLCDTLSRILFSPVVVPIGVITGILGGLFFIFLFLKVKRQNI